MSRKPRISVERARELLTYDPESGDLRRRVSIGPAHVGDLVGCDWADGTGRRYRLIRVGGFVCLAHRVIWLMQTGEWPLYQVDHRDGDGLNNRWANLRDITPGENQQNRVGPQKNNTTGFLGVTRRPNGKFVAGIKTHGKRRHLGEFTTAEEASAAYIAAKRQIHPACTI